MNWPKGQVSVKSDWPFIKCTGHGQAGECLFQYLVYFVFVILPGESILDLHLDTFSEF